MSSTRLVLAVVLAPALAVAQPTDPVGVPPSPLPPPVAETMDEARVREIVDREVARILAERGAKEAAEKAAKEAQEKEAAANADASNDISGANGFMDTRLAFTITNENILAKPGETIPSVPGWRFGAPNSLGVLFFDNYDTRFSGFETLSHAVMYRNYTRGHLQAEGAFLLRINELSENVISLSDAGSYIQISNWKDPTHKDPTRISFLAFPVSADRFRLGYSYRLTWGGNPEYSRARSSTPGAKIQYDFKGGYVFVGGKSGILVDPNDGEQKSSLAGLAGGGIDIGDIARFEVNGGYFDRGYNELQDVQSEKVQLFGASAQLSFFKGTTPRNSIDLRLYKYNNERVTDLFRPESYPGGVSWLAQTEFTVLGQTLKDPENVGSTRVQVGKAGDLNVRVKINRVRLRLDLSYRDLAFILHSQPSLPPYSDFPDVYEISPNYFAAVGADRNWGDWLTLGLVAGVEKPATLTSPAGIAGTNATGVSTAVIRNNNIATIISVLPTGEEAVPQVAVKGSAKIDFAKMFTALVEVFYSYDGNQSTYGRVCDDPDTCPLGYRFGEFNQLGVNSTLQARF